MRKDHLECREKERDDYRRFNRLEIHFPGRIHVRQMKRACFCQDYSRLGDKEEKGGGRSGALDFPSRERRVIDVARALFDSPDVDCPVVVVTQHFH